MAILIVDDAELIRKMLIEYLEHEGYTAVGVASGREAIEYLHSEECELVLLDVMIPIMNGWEILQTIMSDPSTAAIPVVIMSAAEHAREVALEQGAVAYIAKPLDFDKLLDIVRYHMKSRQVV